MLQSTLGTRIRIVEGDKEFSQMWWRLDKYQKDGIKSVENCKYLGRSVSLTASV